MTDAENEKTITDSGPGNPTGTNGVFAANALRLVIFRYLKPRRTCGTTKRNANRNRSSDIHSHQTQQKPKETHSRRIRHCHFQLHGSSVGYALAQNQGKEEAWLDNHGEDAKTKSAESGSILSTQMYGGALRNAERK